jgi:ribonuclease BN (tRNA processing enzyme)
LLLTHWHPDHVLGLHQLCESLKRSATRNGLPFQKIPLFCTRETYEYLRDQGGQTYVLTNHLDFREIVPEQPFEVGANPIVRFTPIPVAHGGIRGSVIFIADIGSKKVVFAWDIDVPSNALANGVTNQEVIERNRTGLAGARLLFVAANTWAADDTPEGGNRRTGHASYLRAQSYVDLIKAEKTYLMHMSGHEDGKGHAGYGWTDSRWQSAVEPANVAIARQGMVIDV